MTVDRQYKIGFVAVYYHRDHQSQACRMLSMRCVISLLLCGYACGLCWCRRLALGLCHCI